MNRNVFKFYNEKIFSIICLLFLAFYYLLFINRGIVTGDEGYSVHIAERILQGQIPYRDFFLQYPPGYFYLLAGLYKTFGISIIIGRLLTFFVCLGIFIASLFLLREYGITSRRAKIIALFCTAAFGYPLINIPIVVWPSVLITMLLMIFMLRWFRHNKTKDLLISGVFLCLLFLIKQNIAIAETAFINIILLFSIIKHKKIKTILSIFFMNIVWIFSTISWMYFFFLRDNFLGLLEFISFNQRYINIYPFSYPPLSYLSQALGFLKLLPYYIPIIFFVLLFIVTFQKATDKKLLVLFLPLIGFFMTIFPTSDLLHVYPYFGLTLVSLYLFLKLRFKKFIKVGYIIIIICVISGFYLTFFRGYYRYQAPYRFQDTSLDLPKTKNIYIDKNSAQNITSIYKFINTHTLENDYIFAYSFSPILYFLFERQNPSKYSIYYPGYLTKEDEEATIVDIKKRKVKYVISDGFDKASTPLSLWINNQKKVRQYGQYTIFYVKE